VSIYDNKERKARTGKLGQDRQKIQNRIGKTGQAEHDMQAGQAERDRQIGTGRIVQAERDIQNRIDRKEWLNGKGNTGKKGRTGQTERNGKTRQAKQDVHN
jgi:hypothetical protein